MIQAIGRLYFTENDKSFSLHSSLRLHTNIHPSLTLSRSSSIFSKHDKSVKKHSSKSNLSKKNVKEKQNNKNKMLFKQNSHKMQRVAFSSMYVI